MKRSWTRSRFRLSTDAGDNLSKKTLHPLSPRESTKRVKPSKHTHIHTLCLSWWAEQLGKIVPSRWVSLPKDFGICRRMHWESCRVHSLHAFDLVHWKLADGVSGAIKTQSQLMSTKTINGIPRTRRMAPAISRMYAARTLVSDSTSTHTHSVAKANNSNC